MKKKHLISSIIWTVVFIVYTILIMKVDVKAIGPNNTEVGFAKMNGWFKDLIGQNMFFYKVTEVLGIVLLLLVLIYACIGLYQLIKRKSLFKIDREIIILGVFYVVVFALYILFDKVAINYRPILMDGELEPSFPSSHTMLALCVGLSSLIVSKEYFNKKYINIINIITCVLIGLVVAGRMLSGVHWLTDIFGGVILSCTLLEYFKLAYEYKK
jgi:undecaprenyl-diphosphatase